VCSLQLFATNGDIAKARFYLNRTYERFLEQVRPNTFFMPGSHPSIWAPCAFSWCAIRVIGDSFEQICWLFAGAAQFSQLPLLAKGPRQRMLQSLQKLTEGETFQHTFSTPRLGVAGDSDRSSSHALCHACNGCSERVLQSAPGHHGHQAVSRQLSVPRSCCCAELPSDFSAAFAARPTSSCASVRCVLPPLQWLGQDLTRREF
jgi:hypothetical protein